MTVSGSINRYNEIDTNLKRFKFPSCFPYETGTDLSCVIISLIILLSSTQLYPVLFFFNLHLGRKETKNGYTARFFGCKFFRWFSTVVDRSVIYDL